MDELPYAEILSAIIKRFVRLVGATSALQIARKLPHLQVDEDGNVLDYDKSDPVGSIKLLIEQYGSIFGETAVVLSRQAARPFAAMAEEGALQEAGLVPFREGPPMRILLVDDHVLFREGLAGLIDPQPDLTIVGQAGTGKEALALVRKLRPEMVVLDAGLPDGSGIDVARAILTELPETKIVFLTVHEDDEQLFAAIRAGALGYLFKNVRSAELLKRLRGVGRGEAGVSPDIARRILEEFSRTPTPHQADIFASTELTQREIDVVRELVRGASNKEIAQRLVISENTVKNHVRNVLSKLHLRSRHDVVDYARDHGLTPPPNDSSPPVP